METQNIRIMGILITDRVKEAGDVQAVLTAHGGVIKSRLGLHETEENNNRKGLILLELCGDNQEKEMLEKDLSALEGVMVQRMDFEV